MSNPNDAVAIGEQTLASAERILKTGMRQVERTYKPRRRRWTPPEIGTEFVRSRDQQLFTVQNIYRRDQQVLLVSRDGSERTYPFARDLDREYEQVNR